MGADPAVRVTVPFQWAEVTGAVLMDLLGPYQEIGEADLSCLVFYPFRHGSGYVPDEDILAALPSDPVLREAVDIERVVVPGGWEEGWKDHFPPLTVGRLYIRPPWVPAPAGPAALESGTPGGGDSAGCDPGGAPTAGPQGMGASSGCLLDVVVTPGLAFGTGLHATTRGVLELLQDTPGAGPLVDAGTGSGILSIAAVRLGYGPVRAFDDDPLAVQAARSNATANGVEMQVHLLDIAGVPRDWLDGATVLANMTLEPVRVLLGLLGLLVEPSRPENGNGPPPARPRSGGGPPQVVRLLAAGILAGDQEAEVLRLAAGAGLRPERLIHEGEWVAFDLRPLGISED